MIKKLAVIPVVIVLFLAGWFFFFRRGGYSPPPRKTVAVELGLLSPVSTTRPLDPPGTHQGALLVDDAHFNNYEAKQLNPLLSQVVARGFDYEFWLDVEDLADHLRYAQALLIPAPLDQYSTDEIRLIRSFVSKGGRLVLAGDPTRSSDALGLNSIATPFDIIFAADYVYNLSENEDNYRNVIVRDFLSHPVTRDLEEVVFYTAHSLDSPDEGIILANEDTFSSAGETSGPMPLVAVTTGGNVLALPDLTFMMEPYVESRDNQQLVANLAEFITTGERDFYLEDFPLFFTSPVDVVFADSSLLNKFVKQAIAIKEGLQQMGVEAELSLEASEAHDLFFVGSFEDVEAVDEYLAQGGISMVAKGDELTATPTGTVPTTPSSETEQDQTESTHTPTPTSWLNATMTPVSTQSAGEQVNIEGIGRLDRAGAALFYLHQSDTRQVFIVLFDSEEAFEGAMGMFQEEKVNTCRLRSDLAICYPLDITPTPTPTPTQTSSQTPTLTPTPTPP